MPELSSQILSLIRSQNGPISTLRLYDCLKKIGVSTTFVDMQQRLSELVDTEKSIQTFKRGDLPFLFDTSLRAVVSAEELIHELKNLVPGRETAGRYEKLGEKIIRYLFSDHLDSLVSQVVTHEGIRRTDLQATIHSKDKFWKRVEQAYGSLFITFEFKNYSGAISATVIHDASKYLNRYAQKNAILILSRKGIAPNAKKEIYNKIREGQLILPLSDKELLLMLEKKERGEEPSDILYSLLVNWLNEIG